ncbi:MAG: PorP/SprF family type IX secretion system membrane protein, partial [Bacteroidota bacterium]
MKRKILSFLLVFGMFECVIAQTKDGVVSFDVPVKNSLKFNRFLINPAFSYIREDESFVSFLNKRQWMGFEDAPTSYFFSYSGKFRDQNGIGFGIFQRNVGVMTSFGAVANFARNVELNNDSNFTFGLNLAYVNSGLNTSKAFTNEPDASLDNVPKNSLISVNPGINYSTGFIDFGVTANNVFYYNFTNSESVQDDPAKSIAAHAMYTGYFDGYGFLEKARFSALIRGDVAKEKTIFSGSFLFNAPKAGWAQAGYNSVYGASAGIGIILAKKISIGYTVEKGFGNFSDFGLTHEVTLAYKIRGYGEYEDDKPIVRATKKTNPGQTTKAVAVKKKTSAELYKERQEALALKQQQEKERLEAERLRREAALAEAKAKAEEAARLKAEREKELALQGQQNAEARAKALAEAKLKAEQDKAKALADAERLRNEKLAADAKAKSDTAARLKAEQERLAREKAEADRIAREQALADAKAKADEAA